LVSSPRLPPKSHSGCWRSVHLAQVPVSFLLQTVLPHLEDTQDTPGKPQVGFSTDLDSAITIPLLDGSPVWTETTSLVATVPSKDHSYCTPSGPSSSPAFLIRLHFSRSQIFPVAPPINSPHIVFQGRRTALSIDDHCALAQVHPPSTITFFRR
jgi:hypothetical protein